MQLTGHKLDKHDIIAPIMPFYQGQSHAKEKSQEQDNKVR